MFSRKNRERGFLARLSRFPENLTPADECVPGSLVVFVFQVGGDGRPRRILTCWKVPPRKLVEDYWDAVRPGAPDTERGAIEYAAAGQLAVRLRKAYGSERLDGVGRSRAQMSAKQIRREAARNKLAKSRGVIEDGANDADGQFGESHRVRGLGRQGEGLRRARRKRPKQKRRFSTPGSRRVVIRLKRRGDGTR